LGNAVVEPKLGILHGMFQRAIKTRVVSGIKGERFVFWNLFAVRMLAKALSGRGKLCLYLCHLTHNQLPDRYGSV
jgi:hypothetical protein